MRNLGRRRGVRIEGNGRPVLRGAVGIAGARISPWVRRPVTGNFGWEAPPRPDWVVRVNAEASAIDPVAVVPLDAESLLAWACRNTGLSDFGDADWREPFEVLLRGLETEADLHLMGRIAARTEILRWLENRLRITALLGQHPEIHDVVIDRPVFIIGMARSGTTILYEMLARDPRFRVLLGWEAVFPCPPPEAATYDNDPRIEKAERWLTHINRVVPEHEAMHDIGARVPMECGEIMLNSFISAQVAAFYQSSTYAQWIAEHSWAPAYAYHHTILKILQWKNPREHWLLKAPHHLARIPELLQEYPDARLIQTHRDPLKTMASVTSLLGTLASARSDLSFDASAFEGLMMAKGVAAQLEQVISLREDGAIRPDAILDVPYQQLVNEPLSALKATYEGLGMHMSDEQGRAVTAFLKSKPGASPDSHSYADPSPERVARDRPVFERYQALHDVPDEV